MSAPSIPVIQQTAGRGAARAAARRRHISTGAGSDRRAGWLTYVILGVVLVISAYPLYYAFLLASSNAGAIAQHPIPSLLPHGEFFDNVQRVVAVLTSASVVLFSTLAGFSFAKLRFRGRGPLLVFVIATMAVPTQLGIVPLFIVMSKLGWTGKLTAVIVPGMVTAFGVFWMTQYLESALPYELIEAARVDGASMIQTFYHVALPAARPAASMLALFTFVGSWTNFFWPFIVLGSSNPTLPVAVQLLQSSYFKDMALIMAGVTLSVVPLVVVFIFAGRQLVAGIMQGAVKG
jgi:cellobiose transport system permease protein